MRKGRYYIGPVELKESREGVIIEPDQLAELVEWAGEVKQKAEAQLREAKAQLQEVKTLERDRIDAFYFSRLNAAQSQDGNIIDIREHIKKRYESD